MYASLVYDGGETVHIPQPMGTPRPDQMQGSVAEQLIEVAGRACYDSMGTGRPSGEYHKNLLLEQKHYSVAEHVHFTVDTVDLPAVIWLGVPDTSFDLHGKGYRCSFNLRHVLEFPHNLRCRTGFDMTPSIDRWTRVLRSAAAMLCPAVFGDWSVTARDEWRLVQPENDLEAHVSLFLEDSLVWALEQNRHRGNISQRSGRFCDQTDRPMCLHPLLEEYLGELGTLKPSRTLKERMEAGDFVSYDQIKDLPPRKKGETDEPPFTSELALPDAYFRQKLGNLIGQQDVQTRFLYTGLVDGMEKWLLEKGNDKRTARKQARSAARYYLGQGLSTEGVWTYSIRHWRHVFNMRVSPHADAAINKLMTQAKEIVAGSRFGHLL